MRWPALKDVKVATTNTDGLVFPGIFSETGSVQRVCTWQLGLCTVSSFPQNPEMQWRLVISDPFYGWDHHTSAVPTMGSYEHCSRNKTDMSRDSLISARQASRKTWPKGVVERRGQKAWPEGVAGRRRQKTFLFSRVAKNSHLLKSC